MTLPSWEQAVVAWRERLGHDFVDDSTATCARAETATFATTQRVVVVLRPANVEEVAACVRIARTHRVSLYPVSGSRNWGYGSRVPVESGTAVIDLARMTRITDYNEDLACVSVEAGVTQRALFAFLKERGNRLWMDPTASSADASVLANALERGHGFTPYADHAATLCDLEVVLGTGDILHTGYRAQNAPLLAPLDPYGVGPQLDGMFFQSNFGIVTRATVWLLREPEAVELAVLRVPDDATLLRALDALRPLRLAGTLRTGPRFSNVYRALMYRGYPWQELEEQTPLPLARALELGARVGIPAWSGIAGLFGTSQEVAAQREAVRTALSGICEPVFYKTQDIEALPPGAGTSQLRAQVALFHGRIVGEGAGVSLPYWRKRDRRGIEAPDLERDRCGTIWTTAITPFTGIDAQRLVACVYDVMLTRGFEPDLSCIALRARSLSYHISITYDRDVEGEDERARACADALRDALRSLRYLPYRLGIDAMGAMSHVEASYGLALHALKRCFDPDGVIAPGRYMPAGTGA